MARERDVLLEVMEEDEVMRTCYPNGRKAAYAGRDQPGRRSWTEKQTGRIWMLQMRWRRRVVIICSITHVIFVPGGALPTLSGSTDPDEFYQNQWKLLFRILLATLAQLVSWWPRCFFWLPSPLDGFGNEPPLFCFSLSLSLNLRRLVWIAISLVSK